jgi:hypothetical protein
MGGNRDGQSQRCRQRECCGQRLDAGSFMAFRLLMALYGLNDNLPLRRFF